MLKGVDLNWSAGKDDSGLGPADQKLSGASGANFSGARRLDGLRRPGDGHFCPTSGALQALGSR
jgi:hypothetical protein